MIAKLPCKLLFALGLLASFYAQVVMAGEIVGYLEDKEKGFVLARKIVREAEESAKKIKNNLHRGFATRRITILYSRAGDFSGALRSAANISEIRERSLAIGDIAFDQGKQDQSADAMRTFQQALVLARTDTDSHHRAITLGQIAELQAKSNVSEASSTFTEAVQIATAIPNDEYKGKGSALFYIGASQLRSGDSRAAETLRQASASLSNVHDNSKKWITAFELAPIQVEVGDDQGALTTAKYCTDEAEFKYRTTLLRNVAAAQARKGDVEGALKTASEIENEMEREEFFVPIIEAQLKKGDLQEAIALTNRIQHDGISKAHVLLLIAKAYEKTGDTDQAERSIQLANELFEKASGPDFSFWWGEYVFVTKLLEMGRLKEASRAAGVIRAPAYKVQALSKVAIAFSQKGDTVTAHRLLEKALDEKGIRSFPLSKIAEAYAQIGDVSTALKTVGGFPGQFDRSDALETIAAIQTQNGSMEEAVRWARSLKSPYLRTYALLGIASGILKNFGVDLGMTV